ncbi:family 43 glycosylhydrolase [Polaribacter sp. Z014]|uniref:family 43 glycosylhydrolase n=1 Tax=Polaribacter sp. Z014 TaxID=2927126 RepID=UPI002020FDBB|nr:family 43 glycosylhydrolase [Polaribacter sp. Z014]MCL7764525.1 family 43 glycosylhydrolase [Polaribacter sp. Z014]
MKNYILYFLLAFNLCGFAQNPIVPAGVYIADPEAHVWQDGKLYIYGSRDESNDYWCSHSHHVLSTDNLIDWNLDENVFSSEGKNDQVSYNDKLLFAPDCVFKEGKYYLYYCSPKGTTKTKETGVAISDFPNGPFKNGKRIEGVNAIDPAVFIDDDGQGYLYWGQGNPKVAQLKSNLLEIDKSTIVKPLDSLGNKYFHEGSSIRKIGEKYYFVFADESRRGKPTCLGYAISDAPTGPFTYKGVIIDNYGSDPSVWNNHGSIEKFKGDWYVFYHRATHNSRKFRKACIEPIKINADGTIDEVEMTSQGASKPLKATGIIEAEWACGLSGNTHITANKELDIPIEQLSAIKNNDTAVYKYLDFNTDLKKIKIKTFNSSGGIVEVRIDKPNGKIIAEVNIDKQDENSFFQIDEAHITSTKGIHAVYFIFKGKPNSILFNIDWFTFY